MISRQSSIGFQDIVGNPIACVSIFFAKQSFRSKLCSFVLFRRCWTICYKMEQDNGMADAHPRCLIPHCNGCVLVPIRVDWRSGVGVPWRCLSPIHHWVYIVAIDSMPFMFRNRSLAIKTTFFLFLRWNKGSIELGVTDGLKHQVYGLLAWQRIRWILWIPSHLKMDKLSKLHGLA